MGTLKRNYPQSYRRLFPHVSEWEKVFLGPIASRDRFGNCNTTVWPLCQIGFNARCSSWGLQVSRKKTGLRHFFIGFIFLNWRLLPGLYLNDFRQKWNIQFTLDRQQSSYIKNFSRHQICTNNKKAFLDEKVKVISVHINKK